MARPRHLRDRSRRSRRVGRGAGERAAIHDSAAAGHEAGTCSAPRLEEAPTGTAQDPRGEADAALRTAGRGHGAARGAHSSGAGGRRRRVRARL